MPILLLASMVPVTAVALLYARWEYRQRGKLTLLGLSLLCVMLLVPNLILYYTTTFEIPSTLPGFVGMFIGSFGLALCLIGIITFRSMQKVLCIDAGRLTQAGPYRWSRNPQYVGWFLFLLGYALTDWSLWCLAALGASAISLHLLILVEEEHLLRVFGEQYAWFCRKVPRYVGKLQSIV